MLKTGTLEKLTNFPNRKKYGFCMVFVWIFKKFLFWKKCLFSKVGFLAIPCWDLLFSKGGKYFYLKCKKTWKLHFPMLDLLGSTNGMLCTRVGKCSNNNVENIPRIWLTTYPKTEVNISKEGNRFYCQLKHLWKIDFQSWIHNFQWWKFCFQMWIIKIVSLEKCKKGDIHASLTSTCSSINNWDHFLGIGKL